MKYTIIVTPAEKDSIPLKDVAESIARLAASGYGKSKLHEPTLKNTRRHATEYLLHEVACGSLVAVGGNSSSMSDISALTVTAANLVAWGESNGDDFLVEVVA